MNRWSKNLQENKKQENKIHVIIICIPTVWWYLVGWLWYTAGLDGDDALDSRLSFDMAASSSVLSGVGSFQRHRHCNHH